MPTLHACDNLLREGCIVSCLANYENEGELKSDFNCRSRADSGGSRISLELLEADRLNRECSTRSGFETYVEAKLQ